MKNIVVLISGSGSNLQAIIDAVENKHITNAHIVGVISNQSKAFGLQRAKRHGIPTQTISHTDYSTREDYDQTLIKSLQQYQPDLIVLAGFMHILTPAFIHAFKDRIVNIHPSLLPKYPGLHTHQRAIDEGDKTHGTSVHFVTEELDGGPVILQAKVPIFAKDKADDVMERVQQQEYRIYPLVIQWFVNDRLQLKDHKAWLDNLSLPDQGYATK